MRPSPGAIGASVARRTRRRILWPAVSRRWRRATRLIIVVVRGSRRRCNYRRPLWFRHNRFDNRLLFVIVIVVLIVVFLVVLVLVVVGHLAVVLVVVALFVVLE
jgi:hypothetical protein